MTAVLQPSTSDQEFVLSRADFDRIRRLILEHAGISLHAGKQAMVYSRLSRRLRETGHRSFAGYRARRAPARPTASGRSSSTA